MSTPDVNSPYIGNNLTFLIVFDWKCS
uniref:Uncharacterized protein n=1 Tax=Rhizophora mucronata TaxID=61149 RepID=A0A2P2P9W6_RHIMU